MSDKLTNTLVGGLKFGAVGTLLGGIVGAIGGRLVAGAAGSAIGLDSESVGALTDQLHEALTELAETGTITDTQIELANGTTLDLIVDGSTQTVHAQGGTITIPNTLDRAPTREEISTVLEGLDGALKGGGTMLGAGGGAVLGGGTGAAAGAIAGFAKREEERRQRSQFQGRTI